MALLRQVEAIMEQFRGVFRRQATFEWFVLVLWALMLRWDMAGVTSIVRVFGLAASAYPSLLHFFHSTAFSVQALCQQWVKIVRQMAPIQQLAGQPLYVVDGILSGKAGHKMPAVKCLHQESNNNTKPELIMGHFWGALSVLIGTGEQVLALPLRLQIQDGLKRSPAETTTLVDKMHRLVTQTVQGGGTILADAYYSSLSFLQALRTAGLHYIGKVRSTTVAYEQPAPRSLPHRRGRPRQYGAKVKLKELFAQPLLFQPASLVLYGGLKHIRFAVRDLLWQGLLVRFVLTIYPDGTQAILLSTNLELSPEAIIYAYSLRFKIEVSFKALVHVLVGFGYHFWMKAWPHLKWGTGNRYLHRASPRFRRQIARKIEAYERFVNLSAIALGILQLLATQHTATIWSYFPFWMRTLPAHGCPSENVVRLTLQHLLQKNFLESPQELLLDKILTRKPPREHAPPPLKVAS